MGPVAQASAALAKASPPTPPQPYLTTRLFLRAEVSGKEDAGLGPLVVNRGTGPLREGKDEGRQVRRETGEAAAPPSSRPSLEGGEGGQDDL